MLRNLTALADQRFDLAIIGGGATGAFIAWEAAARGLRVALVEKADFCGATSAANSRLIHGGLRYLAQGQFGVVRESVRERAWWLRAAPHLVAPLPFLLPSRSALERLKLGLGLRLYDFLGRGAGSALPRARSLDPADAERLAPLLAGRCAHGAWLYHDAQMHAPERLALAALAGAGSGGAVTANYVEATGVATAGGRVAGLEVRDVELGDRFTIRAPRVVNAAGPWAGLAVPGAPRVTLSAGIHLVVARPPGSTAVALRDEIGHFFLLPWRDHLLIGTTDEHFAGTPDSYRVRAADVERFATRVRQAVPALELSDDTIRHAYGGLRALASRGADTYRASRRAEIIDHARRGCRGLYTVLGGKWTTSRALAAAVVDRFARAPSPTGSMALPCVIGADAEPAAASGSAAEPRAMPAVIAAHLLRIYGSDQPAVLAEIGDEPPLDAVEPVFEGQARLAARIEMARSLADFVFRRSQLGLFGPPPRATLRALASAMAGELGWTPARIDAEVRSVEGSYLT